MRLLHRLEREEGRSWRPGAEEGKASERWRERASERERSERRKKVKSRFFFFPLSLASSLSPQSPLLFNFFLRPSRFPFSPFPSLLSFRQKRDRLKADTNISLSSRFDLKLKK